MILTLLPPCTPANSSAPPSADAAPSWEIFKSAMILLQQQRVAAFQQQAIAAFQKGRDAGAPRADDQPDEQAQHAQ